MLSGIVAGAAASRAAPPRSSAVPSPAPPQPGAASAPGSASASPGEAHVQDSPSLDVVAAHPAARHLAPLRRSSRSRASVTVRPGLGQLAGHACQSRRCTDSAQTFPGNWSTIRRWTRNRCHHTRRRSRACEPPSCKRRARPPSRHRIRPRCRRIAPLNRGSRRTRCPLTRPPSHRPAQRNPSSPSQRARLTPQKPRARATFRPLPPVDASSALPKSGSSSAARAPASSPPCPATRVVKWLRARCA